MKKILVISAVIISIMLLNKKNSEVLIPKDNIRFRVIANSNSLEDQKLKLELSEVLANYINSIPHESNKKEDVLIDYINNKDNIENFLNNYLNTNNIDVSYKLNIGRNKFNKKIYKGVTYDAGYYDSIVLELGKSSGLNWWCVVYPPLCDMSSDSNSEIEYKSYIKEKLDNLNI